MDNDDNDDNNDIVINMDEIEMDGIEMDGINIPTNNKPLNNKPKLRRRKGQNFNLNHPSMTRELRGEITQKNMEIQQKNNIIKQSQKIKQYQEHLLKKIKFPQIYFLFSKTLYFLFSMAKKVEYHIL